MIEQTICAKSGIGRGSESMRSGLLASSTTRAIRRAMGALWVLAVSALPSFGADDTSLLNDWAKRVIQSAELIEDAEQRLSVQADLARIHAWMGQPLKARDAALAMSKADRQGLTMRASRYAVIALREAGLDEQIDPVIEIAEDANERDILSYGVMDLYLHAGHTLKARRYAQSDKTGHRNRVLAVLFCKHEMVDEAMDLLNAKFRDPASRDKVLVAIVNSFAQEGQTEKARQFLGQIQSAEIRRQTASVALLRDKEADSLDVHRERYDTLTDRRAKSSAAPRLADLLIDEGKLSEAAEVIEAAVAAIEQQPSESQISKFGTYGDQAAIAKLRMVNYAIASAWWNRDERSKCNEQFELAEAAYRELDRKAALVQFVMDEARISTLIKLNRIDEVATWLKDVDDERLQDSIARSLAIEFIERADIEQGLLYAEKIRPNEAKRKDVAVALLMHADFEQAIRFIEPMNLDDQVSCIEQFAWRVAVTQNSSELPKIYDGFESPLFRCQFASTVFAQLKSTDVE